MGIAAFFLRRYPMICVLLVSLVNAASVRSDDVILAVGHGGHRMTSRDGWTWENHVEWGKPGHDQNDLNVAANFQGAFFVGGGYSYARLTATRDGKTWSEGRIPGGSPLFGLEVSGDELFAIGLRGDVHKTRDGERWELVGRADMPTKTHWIRGTALGNGLIVGSGDYGPALVCDPATGAIAVTQMAGQTDKNATWRRVAFGNGRFVVGGQAGLLATTCDGKTWEKNQTVPERGDVYCVEWTGRDFIAITSNGVLRSPDGLTWDLTDAKLPRQIRRVGSWLYGYGWPPSKFSRSTDGGATWELVPNPREWQGKAFAGGPLAGGPPPQLPGAPEPAGKQ
jgi:hypothetical protein